ncbi:MAG: hypothetical protein BWY75_01402 [bacterium ADurb.Bin425]|nr:MAG: hypothetical protein BWY75_01402 [bacterium ADurb.Bin425]
MQVGGKVPDAVGGSEEEDGPTYGEKKEKGEIFEKSRIFLFVIDGYEHRGIEQTKLVDQFESI